MTQGPQPCSNNVSESSRSNLADVFAFFLYLSQPISMASSEDAEGTLTPVDFIQLQHYMECKSPRDA